MSQEQNRIPLTTAAAHWPDQKFPSLDQETRTHVGTEQAAFYCMRKPQTLRMWAALEPKGAIKPVRVNGRLAWPVAAIRKLLNREG
jgi:hypothetical protein